MKIDLTKKLGLSILAFGIYRSCWDIINYFTNNNINISLLNISILIAGLLILLQKRLGLYLCACAMLCQIVVYIEHLILFFFGYNYINQTKLILLIIVFIWTIINFVASIIIILNKKTNNLK